MVDNKKNNNGTYDDNIYNGSDSDYSRVVKMLYSWTILLIAEKILTRILWKKWIVEKFWKEVKTYQNDEKDNSVQWMY